MTQAQKITGLIAAIVLVLVIPVYSILEPHNQAAVAADYQARAVANATDLYAQNCALCHGAAGEGIGQMPALNTDGVKGMTEPDLYRVVSRGRDNTSMVAWAVDEGGILTDAQVKEMVTFLQHASWAEVEQRVADLGLMPPELVQMEIGEDMLTSINALPDSEGLAAGLTVYAENCSACHGVDGSGTALAPAVNTAKLRASGAEEITRIVSYGVPNTLMAGWEDSLAPEQIANVVTLLERWPELETAGVAFPEVEPVVFEITPELIAQGQQLYNVACKSCHGVEAYGTRMAPSLNNQQFLGETPDAAIYQIIAGGVPETAMPAWGGRLTEEDLSALVAYLRSLESSAPPIANP
jgi:cbb3-type cytochrome c oxidase subunit III